MAIRAASAVFTLLLLSLNLNRTNGAPTIHGYGTGWRLPPGLAKAQGYTTKSIAGTIETSLEKPVVSSDPETTASPEFDEDVLEESPIPELQSVFGSVDAAEPRSDTHLNIFLLVEIVAIFYMLFCMIRRSLLRHQIVSVDNPCDQLMMFLTTATVVTTVIAVLASLSRSFKIPTTAAFAMPVILLIVYEIMFRRSTRAADEYSQLGPA